MTGLYPHQAGIGSMTQDMDHPSYQGRIKANATTIAEVLSQYDYNTYQVGKWHVGNARTARDLISISLSWMGPLVITTSGLIEKAETP